MRQHTFLVPGRLTLFTPADLPALTLATAPLLMRSCRIDRGPSLPRPRPFACSTWPHALGGPYHLQAFSLPHSEGYIISKSSTSSSPTFFPFWVNVLFCIRDFLAHSLLLGSVQHLCVSSIFVLCLPAPYNLISYCISLLAYFSFPPFLCPVYWERTRTSSLEGFLSGWLSSCLSSLSLFIRNGSTSFRYTRWSSPFYWRS